MIKTAIVTGAYGAIGKAIAEGLARENYSVCLTGRDQEKLESACRELSSKTGNKNLFFQVTDLSDHQQISRFAASWDRPLHLLVNNAATAPKSRTETAEGIEMQWAVNVLSYSRMTEAFVPFMQKTDRPRIVNVASYWAGGLDMDDPEFKERRYNNDSAYRQAKQANRMMSAAFSAMLEEKGVSVNACHPGDVNSKLSNAFGFGGHESPAEGAATPLYLALSGETEGKSGGYYEHLKPVRCPFSLDPAGNLALLRLCQSYP